MKRKKILKYAIRIHLYAGLFASTFLMLAGFTAINFQHQLLSAEPRDTTFSVHKVHISDLAANELSQNIASQLNIIGHTPNWDYRFNKQQQLISFKIHRPAKRYNVEVDHQNSTVKVAEIHYKAGAVLNIMHKTTMIDLSESPLVTWAIFGQISAVSAFIAVIVSLYFWWTKSVTARWQWFVAIISSLIVLIYVFYLWQKG